MTSQEPKPECQAVNCTNEAVDNMGLFCPDHWSKIPADARGTLESMYDEDKTSKKHLAWTHQVRKLIGYLMSLEHQLKRAKDNSKIDEFHKPSPFRMTMRNDVDVDITTSKEGSDGV